MSNYLTEMSISLKLFKKKGALNIQYLLLCLDELKGSAILRKNAKYYPDNVRNCELYVAKRLLNNCYRNFLNIFQILTGSIFHLNTIVRTIITIKDKTSNITNVINILYNLSALLLDLAISRGVFSDVVSIFMHKKLLREQIVMLQKREFRMSISFYSPIIYLT